MRRLLQVPRFNRGVDFHPPSWAVPTSTTSQAMLLQSKKSNVVPVVKKERKNKAGTKRRNQWQNIEEGHKHQKKSWIGVMLQTYPRAGSKRHQ